MSKLPTILVYFFTLILNSGYCQEVDKKQIYSPQELSTTVLILESNMPDSSILSGDMVNKFNPFNPGESSFGNHQNPVWLKINLERLNHSTKWLIVLKGTRLVRVTFYFLSPIDSSWISKISGAGVSYNKRTLDYHETVFNLGNSILNEECYIKITEGYPLNIGFSVMSEARFLKKQNFQQVFISGYFFLALLMSIVSIVFFIVNKQYVYLWYCAVVVLTFIGFCSHLGIAFKFLWPSYPEFNLISSGLIGTLNAFVVFNFARRLLKIEEYSIETYKVVRYISMVLLVTVPLNFLLPIEKSFYIGSIVTTLTFPVIIHMIYIAHKNNNPLARYYFYGWFSLALGATIYILDENVVYPNKIGIWGVYVGAIIEMFFFIICLAIRHKILNNDLAMFKQEVKRLEQSWAGIKKENDFQTTDKSVEVKLPEYMQNLTKRELQILELMSLGLTDQSIADQLFISITTVKAHARNIYNKLEVSNRAEAVATGIKYGLFELK